MFFFEERNAHRVMRYALHDVCESSPDPAILHVVLIQDVCCWTSRIIITMPNIFILFDSSLQPNDSILNETKKRAADSSFLFALPLPRVVSESQLHIVWTHKNATKASL